MGILLILASIVAAVALTGIDTRLAGAAKDALCRITGGEGCDAESKTADLKRCPTGQSMTTSNLNATIAVVRIDKDSTLIREDFSDGSSKFTIIDKSKAAGEIYAGVKAQAGNYGVDWSASAEAGAALAGAKVFEAATPEEAEAFQKKVQAAGGLDGVVRDIAELNNYTPAGKLDDWLLDKAGVDSDEKLPPPDETWVEAGAFVEGNAELSSALGAVGGEELTALVGGAGAVKVISKGENKGDVEVSFEVEGEAAASLTAATLGPGANGKAKVTATLKFDAQKNFRPDALEVKALAGYTGSVNATLDLQGADLGSIGKVLAEGSFDSNGGTGKGVEFGATLDLKDPENLKAALGALTTPNPLTAGRLADRMNSDGELSLDRFDLEQSKTEGGLKGGAGVSLGGGGSSASNVQSGRTGTVRPPGGSFEPRRCKTTPG